MILSRSAISAIALATCCAAAPAGAFELASPSIRAGGTISAEQVFQGFGCTGGNHSPALSWRGAPAGTRSYALTVYDPDAPTGSGWWHWVVVDIPARVHGLPAGAGNPARHALPAGAREIRNDYGTRAYGGPCPPIGDRPHHYIFTVYALKVPTLDLPADASPALTGTMIHANTIGSASFTGRYGR